jgi:hypothetical protein
MGLGLTFDKVEPTHTIDAMAKKTTTIEDLAGMVERGFTNTASAAELRALQAQVVALGEQTATKEDLATTREELHSAIGSLSSEMKDEFGKFRRELAYGPELDELRERIKKLERKVGIA